MGLWMHFQLSQMKVEFYWISILTKFLMTKKLKTLTIGNFVLYGGEDYGIVAVVPNDFECPYGKVIGQAKEGLGVDLHYQNQLIRLTKKDVENKVFSHFKENL